jgi:hypothetical protein
LQRQARQRLRSATLRLSKPLPQEGASPLTATFDDVCRLQLRSTSL